MPYDLPGKPPSPDHARDVNLTFHLALRVTLFAMAIGVATTAVVLHQARDRIRAHLVHSGGTVARLLSAEAALPRGTFELGLGGIESRLASLDGVSGLLGVCVAVEDVYAAHPVPRRCFGAASDPPAAVRWALARLVGPELHYRGQLGQYPGYKAGEIVVSPNLDEEAMDLWHRIRTVLGMTAAILALNLLIYLPVRRALRPADQILAVIERVEAGDLDARMPRPGLVELRRIAAGFDHLTERLRKTMADQRQLAQRLLAVREEERRHLARELHDEFGQCLASIGAEAAFLAGQAGGHPQLAPAARSIGTITEHMLLALQGILCQLRPLGLEEFGLRAGLEQLVGGWRRRVPACAFELSIEGGIDDLPDELTVSLYRIVQESLTNALRHGAPRHVAVRLDRTARGCALRVDDDGEKRVPDSAGSGLGVLGMNERVAALGGRFAIAALSPRGMRVRAEFPAQAMTPSGNDHA
ncbi:ATP-binding protein [Pseudoduganella namucuonensis]|uniref:Protein-histidine pros-kinase n=1 Tax=Pseudoduganella namucuonensis TaxID=1035707 RepID=A0A1I7LN85_9BURK|nr:ATP-binding protein [Pseudoduganella namucuonensis]SFV11134.1 protein-histidine pros-kinase [Pseudoduganella namucuonensis]